MNYNTRLRLRAIYHGARLMGAGITGNKDRIVDYIPSRDEIRTIPISHLGDLYPGQVVYKIDAAGDGRGFFAEFKVLLSHLSFADRYGFIPCVRYEKNYLYYDPMMGDEVNPFEYYFEPIGGDIDASKASNLVHGIPLYVHYVDHLDDETTDNYHITKNMEQRMVSMIKKYIRIKPSLENEFEEDYRRYCQPDRGRVLGVHYRGTDFLMNYKRHPLNVALDQLVDEISSCMNKNYYNSIFLATDDLNAYNTLKNKFGDILVSFPDTMRTGGKTSVAFSNSERQMHHYKLGKEVLRDMYSLSRCDGLICGISQVSNIAQIYKKSHDDEYLDLIVIDNGTNTRGKNFTV